MLKALGVAAMLVIAVIAIYRFSYIPYRFNIAKSSLERSTSRAFGDIDRQRAAIVARRNLDVLSRYSRTCANDVDLYMESAANYRILARYTDAISDYERALTLDRRPEIFFNLGITQIEAGHREQGIRNLMTALRFNPEAGYIPDPELSAEVHRRIYLLRKRP